MSEAARVSKSPATAVQSVRQMTALLSSTSEPLSALDSLALLRALEELKSAAEGVQVSVTAGLTALRRSDGEARGTGVDQVNRELAREVAYARRESPWWGRVHLQVATVLTTEMPATLAALRAGQTTEQHAVALVQETAFLNREDRAQVDQDVADDAAILTRSSVRQVRRDAAHRAAVLDPASVVARRRRAESQRRITIRPAPDTMTWLSGLLPVKDGVAVKAALTSAAHQARAAGDQRSIGQLMADILVQRVTGRAADTTGAAGCDVKVVVNLVMTDKQLLGSGRASEGSANIVGYGQIDADLAREFAKDQESWIRRLYQPPDTTGFVAMESRRRIFPPALKHLIRIRDQLCATPWCDAPIRHIDHITPHASGGATSYDNGQGLCEACNYAKSDGEPERSCGATDAAVVLGQPVKAAGAERKQTAVELAELIGVDRRTLAAI